MKIEDVPSIKGVDESNVFVTMLSPDMVRNPLAEIQPVVELGAAILLDKPIIIIEMRGVQTPENLRKVASKIIVWESPEQVAKEFMEYAKEEHKESD